MMAAATNPPGKEFGVFLCFRGPDSRQLFASFLHKDMEEKGIRFFLDDKELGYGRKKEEIFLALDNTQIYMPIFSKEFASSEWCLNEVEHMILRTSDRKSKKEIMPIFLDLPNGATTNLTKFYEKDLAAHRRKEMIDILSNLPKYDDGHEQRKKKIIALFPNIRKEKDDDKNIENEKDDGPIKKKRKEEDDAKCTRFFGAALNEQSEEETKAIFSGLPVAEVDDIRFCRAVLDEHRKKGRTKVDLWIAALKRVRDSIGLRVAGANCGDIVKSLVRSVQIKLKVKERFLPHHLVETNDLEEIEELMDVDYDDHVRFVVLHGIGGIGKSTLASIIFKKFLPKFDYSSFLEDVGGHDLLLMQKKLLSETMGDNSAHGILDTNDGMHRIKDGLGNKKVLIVVDNVDRGEQLLKLAGSCDWFGAESRIIVTVRELSSIPDEIKEPPSNYRPHKVKEMTLDSAIELFSKHAFTSDARPENWYELSREVVESIGKLPLTLKVVGPLFNPIRGLNRERTLNELKHVPHKSVRETLKISLDKLTNIEKNIFLDIACFCVGEEKNRLFWMWDDCGHFETSNAVDALCFMSLIDTNENNKFWMHDELQVLGRYIVKDNNFEDAGNRRWVQIDQKTIGTLKSNEQKPGVRALSLSPDTSHDFKPAELARFPKLRFLGGESMNFVGDFKDNLPESELRWLSWHHCPSDLQPINIHPLNLVVLDLSRSRITHEWGGWSQIMEAKKLKVLDLTACQELTQTPDFSEFSQLKELILAGCRKLSSIGSSISELKQLVVLNIEGCVSLEGLPEEIGFLEQLTELILPNWGEKPFNLPEALGDLKSLMRFDARGHPGISQIPDSIRRLTNLTHLILRGCKRLSKLPDYIGDLKSLVELDLEHSMIRAIPDSIGELKRLKVIRIGHTKIEAIPDTIEGVVMLEELHAQHLFYLNDGFLLKIGSLTRLRILNLYQTRISTVPTEIIGCSSLQTLIITSQKLGPLPELPPSLECLLISPDEFPVLPDLSNLVHLEHLEVWKGKSSNSSWIYEDELNSPWVDAESIDQLPRSLSILRLGWIPKLPKFSEFKSLSFLYIHGCVMREFPELENLEGLRELGISWCDLLESTPNLSRLTRLQKLELSSLPELAEIPGLGELESLNFLDIIDCNAIQQLPSLSKLKRLWHLKLLGCEKLRAVEGLGELNRLKKLEIKQCKYLERLPDKSAFTKLDTDWTEAAEHTVQPAMLWLQVLWDKLIRIMNMHNHARIH